ncbi:MAG: hypothetical protein AB8B96_09180 [Lysobacterales bacterium]
MKMPILALICVTFLAGCASSGGSTTADTASDSKQAVASQETATGKSRLVCKREKPIGSNRVVKTCRTKDEWDADAVRTQSAMGRQMGRGGACADCGGDG